MKNTYLYCLICLMPIMGHKVYAQCPSCKYDPEILLNYGRVTGGETIAAITKTARGEGRQRTEQTYSSGQLFISARYFLYSCLSFGVTAGYVNQQGNNIEVQSSQPVVIETYNNKTLTIAIEACYIYRFRKYVETYTYIGIGSSFYSRQTTPLPASAAGAAKPLTMQGDGFAGHYTPLGIRFGGRLGGFAEVGIGYKGLIGCGVSWRFGRPWWKG